MAAVYAAPEDVRAFCQVSGVAVPADAEVVSLIERAQIDVDLVCGPWPRFSSGLRFDPPLLLAPAREALKRATCAQVEYLLEVGVRQLVAPDDLLSVGGLSFAGRPLPRVGPRLLEELAGHGLILWSGTVSAEAGVEP